MSNLITGALGLAFSVLGLFLLLRIDKRLKTEADKKWKKRRTLCLLFLVISAYLFLTSLIRLAYPHGEKEPITVEIWAKRVNFFGLEFSESVVHTWAAMAVLVVLALILRFTVVRRMKEIPKGAQNVLEICVGGIADYTKGKAEHVGSGLASYLFALAAYMVSCDVLEMFGLRAPTSDITVTFALALITFFLINYYGIKKKGVSGRLKSLAQPTPVVFPIKVITDLAIPVSLACRLFGNMLAGMIVMHLVYSALGSFSVGPPGVLGLYFNVFHPLIQVFIFITLSLTFIGEATE